MTARPMVLPSWMEWNTPRSRSASAITRTICTTVATRNRMIGVVGRGVADQAKLTHPGLLGLMSDLRAGCGVRRGQAVKGDAPSSFDPCAPASFDKFPPSKEL